MIPTSTNVRLDVSTTLPADLDAVVVFAAEGARISGDAPMVLPENILRIAARLLEEEIVRGTSKEVDFDLLEMPGNRLMRIYAAGMGPVEKMSLESVRRSAGALMRAIRRHHLKKIAIVPPVVTRTRGFDATGTQAAVTGLLLTAFEFTEYYGSAHKSSDNTNGSAKTPITITLLADASSRHVVQQAMNHARTIADAQNFARTIASRPGNTVNPPNLARIAQDLAKETKLGCKVLDDKEITRLGMGGLAAVGAGSSKTPPRLIVLEHKPSTRAAKAKKPAKSLGTSGPLLIVGKAITFDTGGISIKPAEKMGRMIYDKSGGMAVLGLMAALAKLAVPVHVVGILSSAENHVSDTAYRPGDILRMYNGVTVEVTNTDAEGRLVLGDALAWGIEKYRPSAVIDIATLTGGVVTALGRDMCGIMSNNDALVEELAAAAVVTGEKMWRLPCGQEQREQIKSDHADIVNSAGREAHPLQGGAFLSHFVPEDGSVPWAHLDIAGVADSEKDLPYYCKGSTGWGVRTLVRWVEARAAATAQSGKKS